MNTLRTIVRRAFDSRPAQRESLPVLRRKGGVSPIRHLATAGALLGALVASPALAQVKLNPQIKDVDVLGVMPNDDNILYRASSGAMIAGRLVAPGWGFGRLGVGMDFTVWDAPRKRFIGAQWGAPRLSVLQQNSSGGWDFIQRGIYPLCNGKIALDPATGDIFVRGMHAGGALYVVNLEKGNYGTVISTVQGWSPILDTSDPDRSIYFKGVDNHPYRTYYSGGQWKTQQLSNDLLLSDPRVNYNKSIIYRDSQNRIASTWWNGSMWLSSPWAPPNGVQANNVLAQPEVGTFSGDVLYTGTDHNLYRCAWTGPVTGFQTFKLTSTANIKVANPAFGNLLVNKKGKVFYIGSDNSIWSY